MLKWIRDFLSRRLQRGSAGGGGGRSKKATIQEEFCGDEYYPFIISINDLPKQIAQYIHRALHADHLSV